jgi:hypothetical protein
MEINTFLEKRIVLIISRNFNKRRFATERVSYKFAIKGTCRVSFDISQIEIRLARSDQVRF